ncbi:MAG: hypothetical protein ACKO96_01250 [Flammeovirgaceae bacterium]
MFAQWCLSEAAGCTAKPNVVGLNLTGRSAIAQACHWQQLGFVRQ